MTEAEAERLERLDAAADRLVEHHAFAKHTLRNAWLERLVSTKLTEARAEIRALVAADVRPRARPGVSVHRG